MTKFSSFFYASLALLLFYGCDNTAYYTKPAENGLLIVFECLAAPLITPIIREVDIDSVNWEQQKYYLHKNSISGISTKEISLYLCTRGCQISFYLDTQPLFALPIVSPIAPVSMKYDKGHFLFCHCDVSYYCCLFDEDILYLHQIEIPNTLAILKNEKIKQRLVSIGKLR